MRTTIQNLLSTLIASMRASRCRSILPAGVLALIVCFAQSAGAQLILNVVETGGDNEATDTIAAKWSGQTFPVSVANEPIPGAVIGDNYTVGLFGNHAPAFVDRNHRYTNATMAGALPEVLIPSYLRGQEYIMSGNDNRDNGTYTLDVTVSAPVRVYMLIDNRLGDPNSSNADPPSFGLTRMQWILDELWTPVLSGQNRAANASVPDEVGIDEGADNTHNQWYSVYSKDYPAGTFQLKQADNAGQNMYGAVVTPAPGYYAFNDCALPAGTALFHGTDVGPTTDPDTQRGYIGDDGTGTNCVVHLTDPVNSSYGVFLINDLVAGNNVDHINIKWRSLVGGSANAGADGYSLSWANNLPAAPSYGNPGEEGAGTGLTVAVDTFDNGCNDCNNGTDYGLQIKYQGVQVAYEHTTPFKGFLRKNQFVDAELDVDVNGAVRFTYDGVTLTATLPNWTGIAGGSYMFGARTGGANDRHWIDDIYVVAFTPGLPFIKTQPIDQTVNEGLEATFSATADGSPPLAYQWLIKRTGDADFSPIAGATSASYTTPPAVYPADDNAELKVRISNGLGATDSAVVLWSVVDDNTLPTIVQAVGSGTFDTVSLKFSETLDNRPADMGGTANDNFNYTISDGVNSIGVTAAVLSPDGVSVVLTTDTQLENTLYTVTVVNVEDRARNAIAPPNNTATFRSFVNAGPCAGVLFETFNVNNSAGIDDLINNQPNFPNNPRESMLISGFDSRLVYTDDSHENYGGRMRGVFVAPVSGNWRFHMRSDDPGRLYFNPTGASAAGKIQVGDQAGCCNAFPAVAPQLSAPYALEAGQAYYVELLWREFGGGDYGQVAVQLDGAPAPTVANLLGALVGVPAAPANVGGVLSITQQPASLTVLESASASFTVVYNNPNGLPVCVQWYRNGVAIPGANALTYTIAITTAADNGARFTAQGSIIGSVAPLSAEAVLTVSSDSTGPACVSAVASHVFTDVVVTFNELLTTGLPAVDTFNYVLAGYDTRAVRLNADGKSVTVTFDRKLTIGASYRLHIENVTDLVGNTMSPCDLDFTVVPRGLFIEAEDFNYSNDDGTSPGQHVEFGDPDCSILGKNAVLGVDYNEANNGNDQNLYRAPTGVEAGKPNAQTLVRGDHTISCSYIVGWNDAGDWYNYTRDFGPSKRYNVYARLSSGGAAESAELAVITSDPTQPNQTKRAVGNFSSPATGNWDIFHTIPLTDASGGLASVRLGGLTTLRFSVLPGNLDVDYLSFEEAAVQVVTPTIGDVNPAANSEYARAPKISATVQDQDSQVAASSLKLIFDGRDVTAMSTITDTADGAMIMFQAPGGSAPGSTHTVQVQWQDNQATPASGSYSWSYKEGIYNPEKNLFIEVEDFNTAGQYIPSTAGHAFNEKGQYQGLPGTHDVDYHLQGSNPEEPNYRVITPPNGIVGLNDANRGGAGPRPGFETVSDYKIGWADGGDWFNYTRNYGAGGNYYVFLRASHGDVAATIGGRLEKVDDATTSTQNTTALGNFRAPATGGWDTFTFIPLKDASGNDAILSLNDVVTLRYTVENGGDINYLMLCPVVPPSACPVAGSGQVNVDQDSSVSFQLAGSDANGDALHYTVTQAPAHGNLVVDTRTGAAAYSPTRGYCGTDSFRYRVTDGQCDSEEGTVSISIRCLNLPPTAVISSDQLINLKPEYEDPVLLSCNWWNACLVADGWTSSDPENGDLTYVWTLGDDPVPFGIGPVVTNCLEVGRHTIHLTVTDPGGLQDTASKTIEVVTAPLAIELLIEQINESHKSGVVLSRKTKRELTETLRVALRFAGEEKLRETQKALDAFEKKVRAQVAPTEPEAARVWILWSQAVSDGMEKCIKPPRKSKDHHDDKKDDDKKDHVDPR